MRQLIPSLFLIVLLIIFRWVANRAGLVNFNPLPAFVLCSLIYFRGSHRWVTPALAWVISNPLMNFLYHCPLFSWNELATLIGMSAGLVLIPWVRQNRSILRTQSSVVVSAVLFYAITNTFSFFALPELYSKTWEGFVQAQWTGPLGLSPTWIFLRNLVASNMIFTTLFMLAIPSYSTYTLRLRNELIKG